MFLAILPLVFKDKKNIYIYIYMIMRCASPLPSKQHFLSFANEGSFIGIDSPTKPP
jgi:hypothetical protein